MSTTLSFGALRQAFTHGSSLAQQEEAARALARRYPKEAQSIFLDALESDAILAGLTGITELGAQEATPSLLRAFYSRGGASQEVDKILDTLTALKAIDALSQIAQDAFIPAELRWKTLHQLSHLPSEKSIDLFLQELTSSSQRHQALAIITLGRWRIAKAVSPLSHLLQHMRQTALRQSIYWALANIGSQDALQILLLLLQSSETSKRFEIAEILASMPRREFIDLFAITLSSIPTKEIPRMESLLDQLKTLIAQENEERLQPWREALEEALFD